MVVGSVLAFIPSYPLPSQTPAAKSKYTGRLLFYNTLLLLSAPGPCGHSISLSGLVTLLESSVRSYLVGNAGSRPISEAKQPWACLVLRWGTTGEAHVLYSLPNIIFHVKMMTWVRLYLRRMMMIITSSSSSSSHYHGGTMMCPRI